MESQATEIAQRTPEPMLSRTERDAEVVEAVASDDFLSLPPWFPADKAAAVLRAKQRRFVLFHERNGVTVVADFRQLAAAAPSKSARSYAVALGPNVTPATPLAEAMALMDLSGCTRLPVVVGGVIVGILAREDTEDTFDRTSSGCLAA